MKLRIYILAALFFPVVLMAQKPEGDYNPYVNSGTINPAPLLPAEVPGTGVLSFSIGNTGNDPLEVFPDHNLILTITLSYGEPDNIDPLQALGGSSAGLFSWTFNDRTYTGTQTGTISANSTGTITISYRVTRNSSRNNPRNGFNVNIKPGPYQTSSNNRDDDNLSVYTWTECPAPATPTVGTITQPTCSTPTGSVVLNGLPSEGTWTLNRYPGNIPLTGTGTSITVTEINPGTWYFTVTAASGCTSDRTGNVVINDPPSAVEAPVIGSITQPTCDTGTGSIVVNNLPAGSWTLTMSPGGIQTTGDRNSTTISGLSPGTYSFTVTISTGCVSPSSANAVINPQPQAPSAPVIGNITQPSCSNPTGSVALSGLPSPGTWTLTINPGGTTRTGSGGTATVTGLTPGTYSFTVTSAAGCISASSANAVITAPPGIPQPPVVGTITQPSCVVQTGSVTLTGLPATGVWTLTRNPGAHSTEGSGESITDMGLAQGNYTYTVTSANGCTSAASSAVVINSAPVVPSAPTQRIDCTLGSGAALVTVTGPAGFGYEYRLDQGIFQSSPFFAGVSNGSHTITVRSSGGCTTTGASFQVSCGCVNGPFLNPGSTSGNACSSAPVTVSGNTFGGSANTVTLTENGAGTVFPLTVTSSPFSFTYTPAPGDAGRTVTITLTTNNLSGEPCTPATATYTLNVSAIPSPPQAGTITQPGCTSSTGSVQLTGLPSGGTWTLHRMPGSVSTSGTGTTVTVTGLESGTYTFSVTNSAGCTSNASSGVVINAQPAVPTAPVAGVITQPTCTAATGSIELTGLPANGSWTLIRYPGTVTVSGNGTVTIIHDLLPGTYNFTVTGQGGCTSATSRNIVINPQPSLPQAPVTGNVTPPTCAVPGGRVVLSNLPASGTWTINSIPEGIVQTGTGSSATVSGLIPGNYQFIVTTTAGCVSAASGTINIPRVPDAPVLVIHNPQPQCSPATADITATAVTSGSTEGLTYTYWSDQAGTVPLTRPASAGNGTYYIKGTNASLCFDIKPVIVTVLNQPAAHAGSDQTLDYIFRAELRANSPAEGETGSWSVYSGTGIFENPALARTTVIGLMPGKNTFMWTLTNGVCPPSSDTVSIYVKDLVFPTLITPNNDGKNDYFRLKGAEELSGNQLIIFDRRGVVLFRDSNYRNDWDGTDQHGDPLPDGTYFFVFKTMEGPEKAGYIMIRR